MEQAIGRIRRTKAGKVSTAIVYDVRYPNVYSLKNHKWNRDRRYRELQIPIADESKMFTGIKGRSHTFNAH